MENLGLKIWKDENTNSCVLGIESFLVKEDYDMWWDESGIISDNGISEVHNEYGSIESETIQDIRCIIEDNVSSDTYIDFQIWEEGDAKIHNVDLSALDNIIHELEQKFGKIEIVECF